MSISVVCPGCAKTLKAPDGAAGKQSRCPHCRTTILVPAAPAEEEAGYTLLEPPPPRPTFMQLEPSPPKRDLPAAPRGERPAKKKTKPSADGETTRSRAAAAAESGDGERPIDEQPVGDARKRTPKHWWFALTLVPLMFSLLGGEDDLEKRVERTFAAHPGVMEQVEADKKSGAEVFDLLPGGKLEGAHLSRRSWMHWLYALAAAALFCGLILTLFERGQANLAHVLVVGATTATVGIFMLLLFQWVADFTQHLWLRGGGIVVLLFYLVKLIGFSYRAALDPANGFLSSFFGFTFGVGLCEEFTKAAPVFFKLRDGDDELGWRGACIWGLASGAGFGIAEGILYASEHYNGVATFGIYLVRFISCVGLHAIWTAAVALMIWHNQEVVSGEMDWGDWILALLKVQGVPMILHGLYDTLLKRDFNAAALVVAVASFAWLAFLISRSYACDPVPKKKLQSAAAS